MSQQKSVCGMCGRDANNEDDFCPDCGTLFINQSRRNTAPTGNSSLNYF
ncbi:MAG: hypothetical protein M1495_13405 [Bacteroidetes bacterium]|nr:hypothetical protein [Bacteroidota bacterium]